MRYYDLSIPSHLSAALLPDLVEDLEVLQGKRAAFASGLGDEGGELAVGGSGAEAGHDPVTRRPAVVGFGMADGQLAGEHAVDAATDPLDQTGALEALWLHRQTASH